jgi:1-acyl-sn-glycerol-3-phosphate acyltransferase
MKRIKKTCVVLWKIWVVFLAALFALFIGVFWAFPLAFSNKSFPLAYKGMRVWAMLVFYGSGFRLEVENKPKQGINQPSIISSNHYSPFDILVMLILHKQHPIVFVGKEELVKIPIIGKFYQKVSITVDRSSLKSRGHVFKSAKEKIKLGNSIVIFPEGGISDDRSLVLQRFKDGAFAIAISAKVPLVLYSIKGLKEMFPESWTEGYPGKVKVKLVDVIPTENLSLADKENLKQGCYEKLYNDLILD